MMTLDLAIATHRPDGIRRVAATVLPPVEGIRYVVSWQAHENFPLPRALKRPDVEVHRFDGAGQSLNRNNAIDRCKADVIVMADDDLTYSSSGLLELLEFYKTHPDVDFVTFRTERHGAPRWPQSACQLKNNFPKNFHVACFELSLRRSTAGCLRFCPELGLNSPSLHGGEDEALLLSAINRGLNCMFIPVTVGAHPQPSTGTKSTPTDANLRAQGCVSALMYPLTAFLRIPLKALRLAREGKSGFWRALCCLSRGALQAPGVLRRNRRYLW